LPAVPPAQRLIFYQGHLTAPFPLPNRIFSKSAGEPCVRQSPSSSTWSTAGKFFPFKVMGFPTMMVWL
jgi:hypothetical protein